MLLNLASAAGATDTGVLWGFIRRYAPEAGPESHPGLDAAAARAVGKSAVMRMGCPFANAPQLGCQSD